MCINNFGLFGTQGHTMGAANSRAAEKQAGHTENSSTADENGDNTSQAEDEPADEDEGLKMSIQRFRRRRTDSECSDGGDVEATQRLTAGDDGAETAAMEQSYLYLPAPPDGGYGWVIVFASFMCNLIVDGIAYTFGVFLDDFVTHFQEGKGTIAWAGSLLSGMYLSVGPIVSALANKFGCRAVCIAGSVLSCAAFALSTLSPNVPVLMLTYGIMGGIGFGFIYLPAVVAVGYYFETKRSLATGIAVCGSGVGTFAFAPLADYLLKTFGGWQGANLILAGLILNCAVFGALMRPLQLVPVEDIDPNGEKRKPLLQRMAEEKRFAMERGSISDSLAGSSYFMVQLPDGSMEKRLKMPINIDPGVHSSFNLDQLIPGTPVTPNPTLPTISETKPIDIPKIDRPDMDQMASSASPTAPSSLPKPSPLAAVPGITGMPRNASQPAFSTTPGGIPKNGSVPFFDRMRKSSLGTQTSSKGGNQQNLGVPTRSKTNLSSGHDLRKSLQLRLSTSSFLGNSRNNNTEDIESLALSKTSLAKTSQMLRPLSRKDIFYSGSVANLPEFRLSQKSLTTYRQSVISLPKLKQGSEIDGHMPLEAGESGGCCPSSITSVLSSMMDFSLIKDPVFMMIAVSNIFGMLGLYIPFVYLVDAATQAGVEKAKSTFLLSIIGIVNTVGRVLCGLIADMPQVNTLLMNNICLLLSAVAVAAAPFCYDYTTFCCMAIAFGIGISGYISLTSIILVDLLGLDRLTNAFGLLILFRGAAAIVGSPIAGAIYDATQTYDVPFWMGGFFFLISAGFSFAAEPLRSCLDKRSGIVKEQSPEEDELAQNRGFLDPITEENEHNTVTAREGAIMAQKLQKEKVQQIESVL